MTRDELITYCERHDACEPALDWLRAQSYATARECWAACEDGGWLLWLVDASRASVPQRDLRMIAVECAERVAPIAETWFAEHAPEHHGAISRLLTLIRHDPDADPAKWAEARAAAMAAAMAAAAWAATAASWSAATAASWSAATAASWSAASAAAAWARASWSAASAEAAWARAAWASAAEAAWARAAWASAAEAAEARAARAEAAAARADELRAQAAIVRARVPWDVMDMAIRGAA